MTIKHIPTIHHTIKHIPTIHHTIKHIPTIHHTIKHIPTIHHTYLVKRPPNQAVLINAVFPHHGFVPLQIQCCVNDLGQLWWCGQASSVSRPLHASMVTDSQLDAEEHTLVHF